MKSWATTLGTTAAAATLIIGAIAPAVAAPPFPVINKSNCEAQGGTYNSDRGIKSCTTPGPEERVTALTVSSRGPGGTRIPGTSFEEGYYKYSYRIVNVYSTTNTCVQRNNEEPRCETSRTFQRTEYELVTCEFQEYYPPPLFGDYIVGQLVTRPSSECEQFLP